MYLYHHCNTVCFTYSQWWPLPFLVRLFQSIHFGIESFGNEAKPRHLIHHSHMADVEDVDQIIRGRQQRGELEIAHSHKNYSLFSTVLEIQNSRYCLLFQLIFHGLLFISIRYMFPIKKDQSSLISEILKTWNYKPTCRKFHKICENFIVTNSSHHKLIYLCLDF